MERINPQTQDLTQKNIEQIAQLFPQVLTEKEDENGNIVKAIDFELLKQHLSKDLVEGSDERHRLDWPGKRRSILKANTPITSTLKPDRDSSVNFDTTENLYIEGDNFEVLKILQESYLGKIKMIYIDPPYNTGKDFVYKDNFKVSKEDYEEEIGVKDEEGGKLVKNTDTNGRFHSDWLSMMYERLLVARDLLTDDGVIFMSIDDNEVHNLRKIGDEIFGENNFIAEIIRNTNSAKNQSLFVSVSHENCLIYSKNINTLEKKHGQNKWSVPKNNVEDYLKKVSQLKKEGLKDEEITEELKTLTKYPRFIDFTNYWYFDEVGLYCKDNLGGVKDGNFNPILNPLTNKLDPLPPGGFRYNNEKMEMLKSINKIHFHADSSLPRLKRYLKNNLKQRPKSIMSDDQRPDYSMMKEFNTPFDNPKQMSFMTRIIDIIDNDSIILDFFSGSATTAHATMQLNADDGGNRKFIMVQLPEETDKDSEAFKAGYKTITEIGKKRIRRAGEKIIEENADKLKEREKPLDVGFRVYKTAPSILKEVAKHPNQVTQASLFESQDNIREEAQPEDILTAVLLDFDITLDQSIETLSIANSQVFKVADNALVACFDKNIDMQVVDAMANMQPIRAVFRDACFKDDKDLINTVESRFKQVSPDTKVHVI